MNRSYRTIWNESLGAWVAASEVTSARGKKSSSAVRVALVLGVGALLQSGLAFAQSTPLPTTPTSGRMYLGTNSYTDSQGTICVPANGVNGGVDAIPSSFNCTVALLNGAMAVVNTPGEQDPNEPSTIRPDFAALAAAVSNIGVNALVMGGATAAGDNSIAIGNAAQANGVSSVAMGTNANAFGDSSAAIGTSSVASGVGSVAVGTAARAMESTSTAVGYYSSVRTNENNVATGGIALGDSATVSAETGSRGNSNSSAYSSMALGRNAGVSAYTGAITTTASANEALGKVCTNHLEVSYARP